MADLCVVLVHPFSRRVSMLSKHTLSLAIVIMFLSTGGLSWAQDGTGGDGGDEVGPVEEGPAEEAAEGAELPERRTETILVTPEDLERLGGAGQVLDREQLEKFEYDDPLKLMQQVPGVYVRQEDAFGLRPNIGLRGANSDRSKKVTLMEDEVLVGPAPYSAPAAYYFPLMGQMTGVQVYKGPGSILYGPNTIGGAINMTTREVPWSAEGEVDVAAGSFRTVKADMHAGVGNEVAGVQIQAVHLSSDGFKVLDTGGDTGFRKSEFLLQGRVNTDPGAQVFHRLDARVGIALERSAETYLGLTDADFAETPYRRYAASERDEMTWWRTQGRLTWTFDYGSDLRVKTVAYRHDFARTWSRLSSFRDGTSFESVLADPTTGRSRIYYDVLTGAADSASSGEGLVLANNGRTFVSEGLQTGVEHRWRGETWGSTLKAGARLHYDRIDRNHTADGFLMEGGRLVTDGEPRLTTTKNRGETTAVALYALEEVTWRTFTLTPGVRVEIIDNALTDELTGAEIEGGAVVPVPGLGGFWALTPELGFLAGVHRGFSPTTPGQPDEVEPEFSVNYEAGMRYLRDGGQTHFELIGFFNDYSNLTGECGFSSGCDEAQLDRQYNAGDVNVWGVEALAAWRAPLPGGFALPMRLAWTWTRSEFQTAFSSENPQFGDVEVGDALPYVPEHQVNAQLGVDAPLWSVNAAWTYVSPMRERAGQGALEPGFQTDAQHFLDVIATARPLEWMDIYVKADNVLDAQPLVSHLPFGARPARPPLVLGGMKVRY